MNAREILDLIDEGESTTLEFKRKVRNPEKLAREISAFANTRGGFILVGVDDNGTIYGVRSEKSEIDIIELAAGFFLDPPVEPEIDMVNVKSREVVVVYIPQSETKPHVVLHEDKQTGKQFRRAYVRVGEKSVVASRNMANLMTYQNDDAEPLEISIGDREKRLFAYLGHRERATAKDFSRLVNISQRRAERILIKLVRAGVLQIHTDQTYDYFTLV
ncbi:MAG: RNA-binding domain-containing protein [Candidatus Kapaibacterium sp.]